MTPYKFKTISNKLVPIRDYDEHDVIPFFALDTTGEAGLFVKPTAFDPDDTDGWTDTGIGAEVDGVVSLRYGVKNTVTAAPSGATKWDVLGITLNDTREYDENGNRLINNQQKQLEMQCVLSGQATNILTRGYIGLISGAYVGTPALGHVGVIDNATPGVIRAIAPADLAGAGYNENQVLGKFMSAQGSSFGGYAIFKLEL